MNRRAHEVAVPILTLVTSFVAVLALGFGLAPESTPTVPTPPTATTQPSATTQPTAPPTTESGPSPTPTVGSNQGASKLVVTIVNSRADAPLPGLLKDQPTDVPGHRQLCLVDARTWQLEPADGSSPPNAPDPSCVTFPYEAPDPFTFVLVRV